MAGMRSWRVAWLHNLRPSDLPSRQPDDCFEEFDSRETVTSVQGALGELVAASKAVRGRIPVRVQYRGGDGAPLP